MDVALCQAPALKVVSKLHRAMTGRWIRTGAGGHMQEQEFEIAISNARNSSFPLVLEPWGMPYKMPAQARSTIVFRSPVPPAPPNTVELEHAAGSITV